MHLHCGGNGRLIFYKSSIVHLYRVTLYSSIICYETINPLWYSDTIADNIVILPGKVWRRFWARNWPLNLKFIIGGSTSHCFNPCFCETWIILCKVRFNPREVRLNIKILRKLEIGNLMSFWSFLIFWFNMKSKR